MADFRSTIQRSGKDSRISLGTGSSRPVTDPVGGGGGGGNGRPANPGKGNGGGPKQGGDSFFSSVILLVPFDGTVGATAYTDYAPGNPGGAVGNLIGTILVASIGSITPQLGYATMVGSTGGNGLATANSPPIAMGTGDFTVEFRIAVQSAATAYNVFGIGDGSISATNMLLYTSGSSMHYMTGGVDRCVGGTLVNNTSHSIAVSRVSGTTRLFFDGTKVGVDFVDAINYTAPQSPVLCSYIGGGGINGGGCQEWRITKGVGRYTSSYTPSSSPFPRS